MRPRAPVQNQPDNVPLVEFIDLVFTRMPGRVTIGDSGLCCRVPCLSSAIRLFPFLFSAETMF